MDAILRTDDGGITWNRIGAVEPRPKGRFHGVHFIDGNTGWVVGYFSTTTGGGHTLRGVIYRTTDGGQNWTEQRSRIGTFADKQFNDVFFVDANTGIVVGDKGVVLRTESAGD